MHTLLLKSFCFRNCSFSQKLTFENFSLVVLFQLFMYIFSCSIFFIYLDKSPTTSRPTGAISPVFISENARTFESSPIAIIGGPRYEQMKRWSKDSIISLD